MRFLNWLRGSAPGIAWRGKRSIHKEASLGKRLAI
jgi:hypothetical protein